MEDIGILVVVVVLPLVIVFHYITKWKAMNSLTPENEASFTDLHQAAEKLETRLKTLERILDDEVPNWRSKYND